MRANRIHSQDRILRPFQKGRNAVNSQRRAADGLVCDEPGLIVFAVS